MTVEILRVRRRCGAALPRLLARVLLGAAFLCPPVVAAERNAATQPECAGEACGAASSPALSAASLAAANAARARAGRGAAMDWLDCAAHAWLAMRESSDAAEQAGALATHCTDEFLKLALRRSPHEWREGDKSVDGAAFQVAFRHLSGYFGGDLTLVRAADVSLARSGRHRYGSEGFGIPLALLGPRCDGRAVCELLPPEGVFRGATAWIEGRRDGDAVRATLVIADPAASGDVVLAERRFLLATDTSAAYAFGIQRSSLRRLALWGLIGGREVARRAGLYLLQDYDPQRIPVVMIHGLGSSPLTWARLSNAIWGDPELTRRYQVWHVVYQTEAPLLIARLRVQRYLDDAWNLLDPEGDDAARRNLVLVGHSLGGEIARLLSADSREVLWQAAFQAPLASIRGKPEDLAVLDRAFHFHPYPGVRRVVFMAAPHHGAPKADLWLGRLFRTLIGRRTPEVRRLQHLARDNPGAVRPELREAYREGRINVVTTLRESEPVRIAGESLLPAKGIPYHSIAGVLPGKEPVGDGYVPLASTVIAGASSSLQVESGHDIYDSDEAVAEVLRILRLHAAIAGESKRQTSGL